MVSCFDCSPLVCSLVVLVLPSLMVALSLVVNGGLALLSVGVRAADASHAQKLRL